MHSFIHSSIHPSIHPSIPYIYFIHPSIQHAANEGSSRGRSRALGSRSRFVLTFSGAALRNLWLKEIESVYRVWLASVRLWSALQRKDTATVLRLIDDGAIVDHRNMRKHQLPVEMAVENGLDASVAKALLQVHPEGAKQRSPRKDTLLHRACTQTNVDYDTVIEVLAAYNVAAAMASPTDPHHDTPLHITARTGQLALCNAILTASPLAAQQQNSNNELPLHVIVGQPPLFPVPCAPRGSETTTGTEVDDSGSIPSALTTAVSEREDAAEGTSYVLRLTNIVEKLLATHPASAKACTTAGDTPLHLAVAHMPIGIVKRIARTSPECAASANHHGRLPLHVACRRAAAALGKGGTDELVEFVASLFDEAWAVQDLAGQTPEMLFPRRASKVLPPAAAAPPKVDAQLANAAAAAVARTDLGWLGSLFACCGGHNRKPNQGSRPGTPRSKTLKPPSENNEIVLKEGGEKGEGHESNSSSCSGGPEEPPLVRQESLRLSTLSFLDQGRLPEVNTFRIADEDLQVRGVYV
jgi:ankyrin repeat protein